MENKEYERLPDESFNDYAMRLYMIRDKYPELKNDVIGFILNKESGNDWDESTYRKKYTERIHGYNFGYEKGIEDGYSLCKDEISKNGFPDDIKGLNSVTPKTHLDKMEDLIGEYHLAKSDAQKQKRILRKYMRKATPAVMLAEQYREALNNNEIELKEINDFYLEDLTNTEMVVGLSDQHIGLVVDETYNKYNFNIAVERMNKLKKEVIYHAKSNNINKIHVRLNGDLVEGYNLRSEQAFDIEFNMSDQVDYAQELIYNFCEDLANKGYYVDLAGIYGNHCLFRTSYSTRSSLPDDNATRVVLKNLYFNSIKSDSPKFKVIKQDNYGQFIETINGVRIKYVHGDDERKTDKAKIAKHTSLEEEKINILMLGHLHHYSATARNKNEFEVYHGALMGANDYAKKKVKQISNASQTILIIREDGNYYPLNIDLQNDLQNV